MKRVAAAVLCLGLAAAGCCRTPCPRVCETTPRGLLSGVFKYEVPGGDSGGTTRGRVILVLSRDGSFHLVGLGAYVSDLVPFGGRYTVGAGDEIAFIPSYTAWDRPSEVGAYRRTLELSSVPLLPTEGRSRRFVGRLDGIDSITWPSYLMGYGPVVFRRFPSTSTPWLDHLVRHGMEDASVGTASPVLAGQYRLDKASSGAHESSTDPLAAIELRQDGTFEAELQLDGDEPDRASGKWYHSGRYLLFRILTNNDQVIEQSPGSIVVAEFASGRIKMQLDHLGSDGASVRGPLELVRDLSETDDTRLHR